MPLNRWIDLGNTGKVDIPVNSGEFRRIPGRNSGRNSGVSGNAGIPAEFLGIPAISGYI